MRYSAATLAFVAITGFTPAIACAQVRVERDVDYVPAVSYENKKDRLDIYLPAGKTKAPVIISIHGGALRAGDKSGENAVGQRFAGAGYVTVVINYRLSPVVMHPGHVEDAATAVAWVKHNITKYGGDPDRIVVIGHSAGAYLAALLVTDPHYLAAQGVSLSDIKGVVPVSAFFYVNRPDVAVARPKDVWGTSTDVWSSASPGSHVQAGLPPTLLLYADGDDEWRRLQQTEFANAERAAGNTQIATHMVAGRTHNTVWNRMADADDDTSRSILAFIATLPGFAR